MTFGFSRDSALWTLTIIGAIITYLISANEPPSQWTYQEWLQALAFGVATIAGKLATSPLAHSIEGDATVTKSGK